MDDSGERGDLSELSLKVRNNKFFAQQGCD